MRKPFFRAATALLALLLLALSLSGCMEITFEDSASGAPVTLPRPSAPPPQAPVGDSAERYRMRATLYYYNGEGALTSTLRLIDVDYGQDPYARLVGALLEAPYLSSSLVAVAPEDTRLLGVEYAGGVVTVDLGAELLAAGEEAIWRARAAIARTFLEQEGVAAVNLLIEGQAVEAAGLPLGALTKQDSAVLAGYDQLLAERRRLNEGGANELLEREGILYLPERGVLLPSVVELRAAADELPAALLRAFLSACGYSAADAVEASVTLGVTPVGRRLAHVRLPLSFPLDEDTAAALVLTMARFVPAVGGVCLYAGGESVTSVGARESDAEGAFSPDELRDRLGSGAALYFPRADGTLARVERALPVFRPTGRELLAELIAGPDEGSGLEPVFPEGARENDILGVRVEEGVAHVNLSAVLYGACQGFDTVRERAFVYAVIDTLVANLDSVTQVQFYVAGAFADTLAGRISLLSPLMADPGLVR